MGDSQSAEFKFINQTPRPPVNNEGADLAIVTLYAGADRSRSQVDIYAGGKLIVG